MCHKNRKDSKLPASEAHLTSAADFAWFSGRGVASSPPSQPPWQTQAILQQALALSQPQQAAAG